MSFPGLPRPNSPGEEVEKEGGPLPDLFLTPPPVPSPDPLPVVLPEPVGVTLKMGSVTDRKTVCLVGFYTTKQGGRGVVRSEPTHPGGVCPVLLGVVVLVVRLRVVGVVVVLTHSQKDGNKISRRRNKKNKNRKH